jgi:hypothetical protein
VKFYIDPKPIAISLKMSDDQNVNVFHLQLPSEMLNGIVPPNELNVVVAVNLLHVGGHNPGILSQIHKNL